MGGSFYSDAVAEQGKAADAVAEQGKAADAEPAEAAAGTEPEVVPVASEQADEPKADGK